MKRLVIPDIHLKPFIFDKAADLLRSGAADSAVCLMDIPDDFGKQFCLELYQQTFERAVEFAKEFPSCIWCLGNHDVCYEWNMRESGYSGIAAGVVCRGLGHLRETVFDVSKICYVYTEDNVLFCHGGLTDFFVTEYVPKKDYNNPAAVCDCINEMGCEYLWQDISPIWYRPQHGHMKMYKPRRLLQVVGHTPVKDVHQSGSVLSCDTFSTYSDGSKYGSERFAVVDTLMKEWNVVE